MAGTAIERAVIFDSEEDDARLFGLLTDRKTSIVVSIAGFFLTLYHHS